MTLDIHSILGPHGRIAARLAGYEHRPQQLDMAEAVSRALNQQRHLVVEAGTGVGKSYAYLVPAILHATAREEGDQSRATPRIVVSTHTISLQEQLIRKDLPFLNSMIPREFSAVLVKGRSNYMSLRRLGTAIERQDSLFADQNEVTEITQLADWSRTSEDGSLSDLPHRPSVAVWDEVASDNGNCLGRSCPTYKPCFYYRARRRAQHAQILIVNHALFFSDLALRRVGASILPRYHAAILDEAHTIEAVAGDHLGIKVSSSQVEYALNKLYNDRSNKGLLVHFHVTEGQQQVMRCRYLAHDFFGEVEFYLSESASTNGRVKQSNVIDNQLSPGLEKLARMVDERGQAVDDDSQRQDFVASALRLRAIAQEVEFWVRQQGRDYVYWIETAPSHRSKTRVTLAASPIDVGTSLRETLFNAVPSVILTSATLSVGGKGSFEFFKSRVGLSQADGSRLGSPFDFQSQVRLVVVGDMPDPTQQREEYESQCVRMIQRYVAQTDGRAFVLFTSYQLLRTAASRLATWLQKNNLTLFSQADNLPRHLMLERFKKNPRAVLLGTDSFWQGVDVPGDALQNVIITKLPFSVPDKPLLQARLETIREAGGNPFYDYQLPEAVIKFRQGFGRLIRTKTDKGLVVVLDSRITSKQYGPVFLESIPDCKVVVESVRDGAASREHSR